MENWDSNEHGKSLWEVMRNHTLGDVWLVMQEEVCCRNRTKKFFPRLERRHKLHTTEECLHINLICKFHLETKSFMFAFNSFNNFCHCTNIRTHTKVVFFGTGNVCIAYVSTIELKTLSHTTEKKNCAWRQSLEQFSCAHINGSQHQVRLAFFFLSRLFWGQCFFFC